MDYKMNIAGVERALPLCPLNDKLQIGAFVMFGDVELTVACAEALLKKLPNTMCLSPLNQRVFRLHMKWQDNAAANAICSQEKCQNFI